MRKFDQNQYDQWDNDPDNWVWGLFYYNEKDDRFFLPKRIKTFGYTMNFANPKTIFAFIITMGVLLILSKLP